MRQVIIYDLDKLNSCIEKKFGNDNTIIDILFTGENCFYPKTLKEIYFMNDICKIHKNRAGLSVEEEQLINKIANRFI